MYVSPILFALQAIGEGSGNNLPLDCILSVINGILFFPYFYDAITHFLFHLLYMKWLSFVS